MERILLPEIIISEADLDPIIEKLARRFMRKGQYDELIRLLRRYGCPEGLKVSIGWEAELLAKTGDRRAFGVLEACNLPGNRAVLEYLWNTGDVVGTLEALHLIEGPEEVFSTVAGTFRYLDPKEVLDLCSLARGNYPRELCRLAVVRYGLLLGDKKLIEEACSSLLKPTRMKLLSEFRATGCRELAEALIEANREEGFWNRCVELAEEGKLSEALDLVRDPHGASVEALKAYFLRGFFKRPGEVLRAARMELFWRALLYLALSPHRWGRPVYLIFKW
ncbi:hypothetical protein FH039_08605 [Thermococcus indicus]|uniref:Uncharacterized protein n=1 Tax=Thermococcus indicus TaxID=2586643 RepID=A0A4Y5SLJ4_9EURY|nr:hypothetical protein [Thermococcus indicus]QDA31645.1 hypothetical protein FH039_08605 [Thermococcus indicus]